VITTVTATVHTTTSLTTTTKTSPTSTAQTTTTTTAHTTNITIAHTTTSATTPTPVTSIASKTTATTAPASTTAGGWRYLYCATDESNRALTGTSFSRPNKTVFSCLTFCQAGGYSLGGVEVSHSRPKSLTSVWQRMLLRECTAERSWYKGV